MVSLRVGERAILFADGGCKNQEWQYRFRLKGNLILHHDGEEITTGDAALHEQGA